MKLFENNEAWKEIDKILDKYLSQAKEQGRKFNKERKRDFFYDEIWDVELMVESAEFEIDEYTDIGDDLIDDIIYKRYCQRFDKFF